MIHVPSLEDRKKDIPLLVSHFVDVYPKSKVREENLFRRSSGKLSSYPWTGNVRELAKCG